MSKSNDSHAANGSPPRDAWLARLRSLLDNVAAWASELDWSQKEIQVVLRDAAGTYSAPGLLLQKEAVKVLLEPIASSAPGVDGVVDLYALPAYDDIANLYCADGEWTIRYAPADQPIETPSGTFSMPDAPPQPLSAESFAAVLESLKAHAV
ncbi:MAG: hypothetical protein WD875_13035 [Pirellulales bacterium]